MQTVNSQYANNRKHNMSVQLPFTSSVYIRTLNNNSVVHLLSSHELSLGNITLIHNTFKNRRLV